MGGLRGGLRECTGISITIKHGKTSTFRARPSDTIEDLECEIKAKTAGGFLKMP